MQITRINGQIRGKKSVLLLIKREIGPLSRTNPKELASKAIIQSHFIHFILFVSCVFLKNRFFLHYPQSPQWRCFVPQLLKYFLHSFLLFPSSPSFLSRLFLISHVHSLISFHFISFHFIPEQFEDGKRRFYATSTVSSSPSTIEGQSSLVREREGEDNLAKASALMDRLLQVPKPVITEKMCRFFVKDGLCMSSSLLHKLELQRCSHVTRCGFLMIRMYASLLEEHFPC
jgi:hypothetical protein